MVFFELIPVNVNRESITCIMFKNFHSFLLSDCHIAAISRRLLVLDLGAMSFDLSTQYLRLSVAQGVKSMLERFRLRIVQRVQKLSRNILAYLTADENYEQQTYIEQQQPLTVDTAAKKYTISVEASLRAD